MSKGIARRKESVESSTNCGVLEMNIGTYNDIRKILCVDGYKEEFYMGEKMMKWGFCRKKNFYS